MANFLASGSEDQTVKIWEIERRRTTRLLSGLLEPLAWSPDSSILAARSADQTVTLLQVATMERLGTLPGSSYALRFGPEGKTISTAFTNGTVKFWEVATRTVQKELAATIELERGVSVVLSPDHRLAAIREADHLRLWKLGSEKIIPLPPPLHEVDSSAFSPDGSTFVTGSHDGTIEFWNVPRWKYLASMTAHTSPVTSLAVSPDGKTLASGSGGGGINFWDLPTRRHLGPLKGHKRVVRSLAFSPDGKTLASSSADHTVRFWNVSLRREVASLRIFDGLASGWQAEVDFVEFSPDGNNLVARGRGGDFTVLRAARLVQAAIVDNGIKP